MNLPHKLNPLRLIVLASLFTCLHAPAAWAQPAPGGQPAQPAATPDLPSLWDLAVQGGWFMIPIAIASVITICFTLERLNGLRRNRILPRELIASLRSLMKSASVDPRKLWEICENDESPLANVARAAVLKTGRPQPEVENAVVDAVSRETGEMTRNLRPINVVASIAPLLGLLGTVQGMIMAFMVTSTTSSTGSAKAQELAHGIYTALVTTFAGLCVAVVSVILANFLEGRIERLLRQMEAIFLDLLPRLESFEGRLRVAEVADSEEGGIRVRNASAAQGVKSADRPTTAASDHSRQAASRKLGAPRRINRKVTTRPEDESVGTGTEADGVSDEQAAAVSEPVLDTLRANFDR